MASVIAKRVLGVMALLTGMALGAWFVYNQVYPTDEFKEHFRSVFQLILPVALLIFGWKWIRYQGKGIDQVTPPDLECPELDASVHDARAKIDAFLVEVDKGIDGAYIKFPLRTPQGLTEHVWGYVHFYRDGQFNVSMANDPYDERQDANGRINIPIDDVEDWQIVQTDGRIKGAYSLIALFHYHERRGLKLSPLMKKQKSQLVDAL